MQKKEKLYCAHRSPKPKLLSSSGISPARRCKQPYVKHESSTPGSSVPRSEGERARRKGGGELKGGVIREGVLADFSPRQRVSALPRYPSYVGHTLTGIRDTLSPKTIVWDRTRTVYHIFHLHFLLLDMRTILQLF